MPPPSPGVYKLDVFTLCLQACWMFSKETDAVELKMILSKLQLHVYVNIPYLCTILTS